MCSDNEIRDITSVEVVAKIIQNNIGHIIDEYYRNTSKCHSSELLLYCVNMLISYTNFRRRRRSVPLIVSTVLFGRRGPFKPNDGNHFNRTNWLVIIINN